MTTARRIRAAAVVFELPQKLGILQYVEYEPPRCEWCAGDGCLYEGVLTAEGCRQVADALWELAEKYDVGVWYRRVEERRDICYEVHVYCGPVVNGVELDQPYCRTVNECARQILEEYKRELKRRNRPPPPPPPDPAEELLREWPKLGAFGTE